MNERTICVPSYVISRVIVISLESTHFFLVVPTVQVLLCFYTTAYFGHPNGACFRVKTHSFRLKKQFSSEDTQVSSEDTQCSSEDRQFSSEDTQFPFEAMLFPQVNLYLIDPSDIL